MLTPRLPCGKLTQHLQAAVLSLPGCLILGELERHASEGTLEQYICTASEQDPALLFLQAIGEGPYSRVLKKRGPGLHHIGFTTDSFAQAVQHFAEHGLLLHPISLKTLTHQAVWMCRPGIPFLEEICEASK